MDSIRKWLYKPKRDDKSLLAQFFYADEDLNIVANELDSFDGRKDPERCTTLVNQLRQAQDKVLTITNAIMEVLIGDERADRDFRVKFPEDVLQENLAGQLWFGAECLAAGSSIMNREVESTTMRPLAKAVTKSLENVRNLLREACLRNNTPNGPIKLDSNELVTELLLESLKIFDRLFAEFELAYVSAMVPVKTTQEYELQEMIGVLFSETLQRSLKMKLLTQDLVDDCDPALMFTIPRLAIVSGLLIFPNGPLCIDKPVEDMSEMFRPFRTLLRKIRELLWTLDKKELYMLEKLLCDNEELKGVEVVSDFSVKDEFIESFYADFGKKEESSGFAVRNDDNCTSEVEKEIIVSVIPHEKSVQNVHNLEIPSTSSTLLPPNVHKIIALNSNALNTSGSPSDDSIELISVAAATLSSILSIPENDSGICTETTSLDRSPSPKVCSCPGNSSSIVCKCSSSSRMIPKSAFPSRKKSARDRVEEDFSGSESSEASLSSSTCDMEIALAVQEAGASQVRAKYRSSEDLLHRLFVCIAGVADQLQTNFACDLRNILKSVFLMNSSTATSSVEEPAPKSLDSPTLEASIEYHPSAADVIETNEFSVDPNILAQEALFDTNVYFHLEQDCPQMEAYTNYPREARGPPYPARPPIWIPDIEAPKCMSCGVNFTVVKRRHHCRNCGKVFCSRCSSNSIPLPKYGHSKPVRVCNKCFVFNLTPFTV